MWLKEHRVLYLKLELINVFIKINVIDLKMLFVFIVFYCFGLPPSTHSVLFILLQIYRGLGHKLQVMNKQPALLQ